MKKITLDVASVARTYAAHGSLKKTAQAYAVSEETIRRLLKTNSIARLGRGSKSGDKNHQYKGGIRKRKDGYHIQRGSREKPLSHRVIAEKALGRKLSRGEVVHHINCDKSDNRPCNLLICTQAYHMQLHARMRKHPYWSVVESHAKTIAYHQ